MTNIAALVWRCIWPSWEEEEQSRLHQHLRETPPGAVTLFRRHLPNLETAVDLNKGILKNSDGRTCIAIDEEGGPVRRMPEPFPEFPAAATWAQNDIAPAEVLQRHQELAESLRRYGFAIDFAPVCDLAFDPDHPALKDRCFAADPETAAQYVTAAVRGLQLGGINACGKHFPGHGAVQSDSHVDLDVLPRSLSDVRQQEWRPFKAAIQAGVPLIMAAHCRWPDLDDHNPTTFSRTLIDLVRTELQFDGIILTDDMEMGAIAKHWPSDEATLLALTAGYDAVLFCHSLAAADHAAELCIREAEKSGALREMLKTSAAKMDKLKQVPALPEGVN